MKEHCCNCIFEAFSECRCIFLTFTFSADLVSHEYSFPPQKCCFRFSSPKRNSILKNRILNYGNVSCFRNYDATSCPAQRCLNPSISRTNRKKVLKICMNFEKVINFEKEFIISKCLLN